MQMSSYNELTPERALQEAIKFIAHNQPLPEALKEFLVANDLHDQIVNPGVIEAETYVAV
jgi:hypothetical protein